MKGIIITDSSREDFKDISKHKKEFDISLPDQRSHTLVARSPSGELLGFLEISTSKPKFIEIKRLAVRQKYKRIGVGRKLVGVTRAIALRENKKILLDSSTRNDAQNFWKAKQGFKSSGKSGRYDILEELTLKPKAVKRIRKSQLQKPTILSKPKMRALCSRR